ncbi:DNA polymerase III, delta subunit (plasmid) [Gloeothece citriformis PCC 7424]|uniref:DNA polymerase III subunit delta n=1 Tax=Gloeothece citriformis (strain PCC 7424) TaxID=65393 RepID=B7KLR1_GLOC7|nr:DNA polymerase III subunit delta [Gloeothece citriformis]ACK73733.1 DNA polymerase III, delta subunit [Gloeothece citriformis PCC 7424]
MPILLLTGDDLYTIEQVIKSRVNQLPLSTRSLNYHRFSGTCSPSQQDYFADSLMAARSLPLGSDSKIIVIDCDFKQLNISLEWLEILPLLPQTTTLIFCSFSLDKRLKVVKSLLRLAAHEEYLLIPPWPTEEISQLITKRASHYHLNLSPLIINYLVLAIGNDTARIDSELQKLTLLPNLTLVQVKGLVSSHTETGIKLAAALRKGNAYSTARLLNQLLDKGEHPLIIVASLLTQFRTWLWVKSALIKGLENDTQIASVCKIGNLKRMYFLRQEVKSLNLRSLFFALENLMALEVALKKGYSTQMILPTLLKITQSFFI